MDAIDVIEIAVRGGAAALALLLAGTLLRVDGSSSARLGGLFALGSGTYALVASPLLWEAIGPAREILRLMAIYNSVLFWWFATALLDDGFRWRPWRLAPAGAITLVVVLQAFAPDARLATGSALAMQLLVLAMLAHALVLAVRDISVDLVEARRRFRVVFVILVGTVGVAIAAAELALLRGPIPEILNRVQAISLFALAFGFALWALSARRELFGAPQAVGAGGLQDTLTRIAPEDRALLARLNAAMEERLYAEPGLTVAALAARLGTQEHRLRKVINQGLGYRNFTTFLNERRLADAKAILADPGQARRQVLQVALDLGYGSIGPFNRAFKAATGATPTEYRKQALLAPASGVSNGAAA